MIVLEYKNLFPLLTSYGKLLLSAMGIRLVDVKLSGYNSKQKIQKQVMCAGLDKNFLATP